MGQPNGIPDGPEGEWYLWWGWGKNRPQHEGGRGRLSDVASSSTVGAGCEAGSCRSGQDAALAFTAAAPLGGERTGICRRTRSHEHNLLLEGNRPRRPSF